MQAYLTLLRQHTKMATTFAACITRPVPTAVCGLGSSKVTARPLCLPALGRAAKRVAVAVRAQQQQSQAQKPEVAQVYNSAAHAGRKGGGILFSMRGGKLVEGICVVRVCLKE